jgi:small-conductance mechanosensitive channel
MGLGRFNVRVAMPFDIDAIADALAGLTGEVKIALLVLALVVGAMVVFKLSSRGIRAAIFRAGGKEGDVQMLLGFWKFIIAFVAVIMILEQVFHLGALLAVFGAFGGMLMGWSLQQPVSGFTAWLMISLKRPFRAGDRIQLPSSGLVGDVIEVGPMYTILNQVGGAVGSEDAVGRHVLIPNSMLFSNLIVNYTPSNKTDAAHAFEDQRSSAYILDEVVVRITFNSDWETAESILIDAAREATSDIIGVTKQEPYMRSEMYDYGVMMRLRYMTPATDRPRIAHEITKRIFKEFAKNRKVDFAIPYLYSSKTPFSPFETKPRAISATPADLWKR